MNTIKRILTSLVVVIIFFLILSILYNPIENFKAYAARCIGDITGKWNGNDGGTYWIRQTGEQVMWFGARSLQEGTSFTNVFDGSRSGDTIAGQWADIPIGKIMKQGNISFTCIQEGGIDKLIRKSQTGGFGGTEFSKVSRR